MSELKNNFSDFQQNECDNIPSADQPPQPLERELCPTCVKDPTFTLETNWWDIEDGYLNRKFCEYRVRVSEVSLETEVSNLLETTGDTLESYGATEDQLIILIGIRKLLIKFNKDLNTTNIKSMLFVASKINTYSDPQYVGTLGEFYLVSIPAFNFDRIPASQALPTEPSGPRTAQNEDIVIDVFSFSEDWIRIIASVTTYGFFYSAAQHFDNDLVLIEEDNPVNRVNYKATELACKDFQQELDALLVDAGYAGTSFFNGFFKPAARKLKFVFNEGEEPFDLKSVLVLPNNGCTDYIELDGFESLNKPEYKIALNFLANLKPIIRDITAQETKPWLEFTLDYFYPQLVVNYGLNNVAPGQIEGLNCLIEKQLGLDGLADSIAGEVLSFFDVIGDELQKEACRAVQQSFAGTPGYAGQQKLDKEREDFEKQQKQKKAKLLRQYENDFRNQILKSFSDQINDLIDQENANRKQRNATNLLENVNKSNVLTAIQLQWSPIELIATLNFGTLNPFATVESDPQQSEFYANRGENLKEKVDTVAKIAAQAKYEENKDNYLGNSPYLENYKKAKQERYEKGITIINEIKKDFRIGKRAGSNVFKDFVASVGLCGINKVTGQVFKCLLGGIKIEDLLDKIVEVALRNLEIDMFAVLFAEIPNNVKADIQQEISKQFGDVNLEQLIGLVLTDNPKTKLVDLFSVYRQAEEVQEIFQKYPSPLSAESSSTDDEKQFLLSVLTEESVDIISSIYNNRITPIAQQKVNFALRRFRSDINVGSYDYINSTYTNIPGTEESKDTSNKNRKYIHLLVKNLIYEKKQPAVQAGLSRIKNFFTGDPEEGFVATVVDPVVDDFKSVLGSLTGSVVVEAEAAYAAVEAIENLDGEEFLQQSEIALNARIQQAAAFVPKDKKITDASEYDKAVAAFDKQVNPLGEKLDAVFDVIFDAVLDALMEMIGLDELMEYLKKYPVVDFILGLLKKFEKSCPTPALFYPPPEDFMKTFSLDVCDPTVQLTLPKLVIPSINFKYKFTEMFKKRFQDAIQQLIANILMKLVMGALNNLESSLCKGLAAVGGFAINAINDPDTLNAFIEALDEAFCKGQSDEDGRSQAEKLAEKLLGASEDDFTGMGNRVANIISGVASQNEFLEAMVSEEGESNPQFEQRVSTAINLLSPEASTILGSPAQVGLFFRNLGSYLSAEDKNRIRDLLDSGVPNLPISQAICLTNDQLDEWNDLRAQLLVDNGLSPADARARVSALNNAAIDALAEVLQDLSSLDSPEGPFFAPLNQILSQRDATNGNSNPMPAGSTIDDIYDNTESCNDNVNPIIQTRSPQQKTFEDKMTDAQFQATENQLFSLMTGTGGILGEALRDTEGSNQFSHGLKVFFSTVFPLGTKYVNSNLEYDGDRDKAGQFPLTVGIKLRDDLLSKKEYSLDAVSTVSFQIVPEPTQVTFFSDIQTSPVDITVPAKNIKYAFEAGAEAYKYYYDVSATLNNIDKSKFDYKLNISERLGGDGTETIDSSYTVPVSVSDSEIEYLSEIGFNYYVDEPANIRKNIFKKMAEYNNVYGVDFDSAYESIFENFNNSVVEEILTNQNNPLSYPAGFLFGYEQDDLLLEEFVYLNPDDDEPYNKPEEQKVLGRYANSRIVPLNPAIYGGRYSNPPIYIMPRDFTGWYDIKDRVFSITYKGEFGVEGCDPKTPPLLNFKDIKDRVKKLDDQLVTDSRLAQDPDCVDIRPFGHLLSKKSHASLDGSVRVTIRTYVVEHFLRAFGPLSNIEFREENFDSSFSQYIIGKMKNEMIDLGLFGAGPIVRIVRESYWYTFLEQSVQAYNRMIDVDGLVPPDRLKLPLMELSLAVDRYVYPTSNIKNRYIVSNNEFQLPGKVPDIFEALADPETFYRHAIAYRVYGEDIFNSTTTIELPFPSIYSMKKIRFYSKIYFLRLVEETATIILAEMVNAEIRRVVKNYSEAPTSKPLIYDLKRHVLGMPSVFPGTTCRMGLRQYYLDKQQGIFNPGDVPDFKTAAQYLSTLDDVDADSSGTDAELQERASSFVPRLVLEKYVRLKDKANQALVPEYIKNRQNLREKVSLAEFKLFLDESSGLIGDENISDCFGDLRFTYTGRLGDLFSKGSNGASSLEVDVKNRLILLNPDLESEIEQAYTAYTLGAVLTGPDSPLNLQVTYDDSFLSEGDSAEPTGTIGDIGLSFGLSISMFYLAFNPNAEESSQRLVPAKVELISSDVSVIDQQVATFDPINGDQRYDLECLVNKVVAKPEFDILFDKLLNLRQISSMTAIYCSHGLAGAIGQGTGERTEVEEPEIDDWDRTFNSFAKDVLRMQFGGHYLSNDFDADTTEQTDRELGFRALLNPFSQFSLSTNLFFNIPWWRLAMIKRKVYDKDGVECANPLKDLQ